MAAMHSYLVSLIDRVTGEHQQIIVQSSCPHGMQEYIDSQIGHPSFRLDNPVVVDIDERSARHIPIRNNV